MQGRGVRGGAGCRFKPVSCGKLCGQSADEGISGAVAADDFDLFGGQLQHLVVRAPSGQTFAASGDDDGLELIGELFGSLGGARQATDLFGAHHLCLDRVDHQNIDQTAQLWPQGAVGRGVQKGRNATLARLGRGSEIDGFGHLVLQDQDVHAVPDRIVAKGCRVDLQIGTGHDGGGIIARAVLNGDAHP